MLIHSQQMVNAVLAAVIVLLDSLREKRAVPRPKRCYMFQPHTSWKCCSRGSNLVGTKLLILVIAVPQHFFIGFGNCQFIYHIAKYRGCYQIATSPPLHCQWLSHFTLPKKAGAFFPLSKIKKLSHRSAVTCSLLGLEIQSSDHVAPWTGQGHWATCAVRPADRPVTTEWPARGGHAKGSPQGAPPLPSAAAPPAFAR